MSFKVYSGTAQFHSGCTTELAATNNGILAVCNDTPVWNEDSTELDMLWDSTIVNSDGTLGNVRAKTTEDYRIQSLYLSWEVQEEGRMRREAKAILAAPENETNVDQRINAINLLNEIR